MKKTLYCKSELENASKFPSCTRPNQSMTIIDILHRFASGLPTEQVAQAMYDEEVTESEAENEKADDIVADITRQQGFGFEEADAAVSM